MRTAQEVFDDHWDAVMSGDMDRLLSDYADDALFVRPGQVAQGHAEITAFFEDIGGALDGFSVEQVSVTTAEPIVVLEWQGSPHRRPQRVGHRYVHHRRRQDPAPIARVQRRLGG